MSILNNGIRAWWLEKPLSHNMPTDVVFEEFKPTVTNASNREWIRVISIDDFHKAVNINITRFVEVCNLLRDKNEEVEKLHSQIEIQKEMIENLRKSNEFYSNEENWTIDGHTHDEETYYVREHGEFGVTVRGDVDPSYRYGGKLARECRAKDQELQKRLGDM